MQIRLKIKTSLQFHLKPVIIILTTYTKSGNYGPHYMEAGCHGKQAGSFAEIRIELIIHAKNCLGKWAHKPDCVYVIPTWHVTQKEFWKEFLCLLTLTLLQTRV